MTSGGYVVYPLRTTSLNLFSVYVLFFQLSAAYS